MSKPGFCHVVMDGNFPACVFLDLELADAHAERFYDGWVSSVPIHTSTNSYPAGKEGNANE